MMFPLRLTLRLLVVLSLAALFPGLPGRTAASSAMFLPGFPRLVQQHSLTCESSAASMATRAQVSERQIMGTMPRNPNPNLGFRGNPDGEQGTKLVDYGVYARPLRLVLQRYGYRSDVLEYGNQAEIESYVNRGWPVVAWITYALQPARPRLAIIGGKPVFLVPHEHTVLIVGYSGSSVIANDPWTGKQVVYDWGGFDRAWGYFDDMALAVDPCALPQPVNGLRVQVANLSTAGITWSWQKAGNASRYQIQVVLLGKQDRVVYQGAQSDTAFTFPAPSPNRVYEITVRSISPCGDMSAPRRLGFQTPAKLATPTPTPSPTPSAEATIALTPSPTPVASPSPTGTPVPSPTATATVTATP